MRHACKFSSLSANFLWLIIGSNPADFCNFLQRTCDELGVRILLNTTVTGVGVNHDCLESITVAEKDNKTRTLRCQGLVIAAGPWSEILLSRLFHNSRVRIPWSNRPSSGNHLVVKVPGWDEWLRVECLPPSVSSRPSRTEGGHFKSA